MLGLCELTSCRRQSLLAYFDEHQSRPCGNCDNCLEPPETWDGVEAAQKALSCVYRTGQRFGVNYVIDVLMGKDDERIKRFGHDQINTFGIGQDISHHEWRSLFRQLIAQGYLDTDTEGHGSIRLTEQCRPLLRGETPLPLRKMTTPVKTARTRSGKTANDLRSFEEPLFEALRAERKAQAEEQGVPPYVIFHDSTLLEMTRQRPDSLDKMAHISGVGERKLAQYGQAFLDVILAHPVAEVLDNNLSDTVNETLNLYAQGETIDSIAQTRKLTTNTIYSHLAHAIAVGLIDAQAVLPLSEAEYKEVSNALELYASDASMPLKPVHEALEGAYDYGILKCVQASMGITQV
jgi:ATP-dependent DNA helicase RecQ